MGVCFSVRLAVFILKLFILAPVPSVKTTLGNEELIFSDLWGILLLYQNMVVFLLNMFFKGLVAFLRVILLYLGVCLFHNHIRNRSVIYKAPALLNLVMKVFLRCYVITKVRLSGTSRFPSILQERPNCKVLSRN